MQVSVVVTLSQSTLALCILGYAIHAEVHVRIYLTQSYQVPEFTVTSQSPGKVLKRVLVLI